MDITPQDQTTQPISDDQELAKALAGVLPDDPEVNSMEFEETPVANATPAPAPTPDPTPTPAPAPLFSMPEPIETPEVEQGLVLNDIPAVPSFQMPTPTSNVDLESVKREAIQQLRPLIDHIDLPPEEKFDTFLLLIRSTDDSTLIAPAHSAAIGISDEKRKAEALLDVIKEIDYLSKKDQTAL